MNQQRGGKPSFVIEPIIKLKTSLEIVYDIRHYINSTHIIYVDEFE